MKCARILKFLVSLVWLMKKYNVPYDRIFSKCRPYKNDINFQDAHGHAAHAILLMAFTSQTLTANEKEN